MIQKINKYRKMKLLTPFEFIQLKKSEDSAVGDVARLFGNDQQYPHNENNFNQLKYIGERVKDKLSNENNLFREFTKSYTKSVSKIGTESLDEIGVQVKKIFGKNG